MLKAWTYISNPLDTANALVNTFTSTIEGIYLKVLSLTGYEGAKGGSYVGTNIGMSAIDPTGKILAMAGVGFFAKVGDKINRIVWSKTLGLGHTGRFIPNNLTEKLAIEEAMSNPLGGIELPISLTDSRWPGSEGWIKKSQNINGIEIHYVFNTKTYQIDDFKFKD